MFVQARVDIPYHWENSEQRCSVRSRPQEQALIDCLIESGPLLHELAHCHHKCKHCVGGHSVQNGRTMKESTDNEPSVSFRRRRHGVKTKGKPHVDVTLSAARTSVKLRLPVVVSAEKRSDRPVLCQPNPHQQHSAHPDQDQQVHLGLPEYCGRLWSGHLPGGQPWWVLSGRLPCVRSLALCAAALSHQTGAQGVIDGVRRWRDWKLYLSINLSTVYLYVYIYIYICVCVQYLRTNVHAYKYTYTYTHVRSHFLGPDPISIFFIE